MLTQTLTVSEAAHQLLNDDNANWSYEGAHAIADYLDDMWEDCGAPEFGFNVVDVRYEYTELTAADLVDDYGDLIDRDLPSDGAWTANCEEVMEELCELIRDDAGCFLELGNGNYIVSDLYRR